MLEYIPLIFSGIQLAAMLIFIPLFNKLDAIKNSIRNLELDLARNYYTKAEISALFSQGNQTARKRKPTQ